MNKPLKYTNCPLCKTVKLKRDKRKVSLFVCPRCGLHISPNRRKSKADLEKNYPEWNKIINAEMR